MKTRLIGQFLILLFPMLLLSVYVLGQSSTEHIEFYEQSTKVSNTGMMVLGSWAIGNMAIGAYGWKNNTGTKMYFHQMNVFWNVVNLSIAGISLYNNWGIDYAAINYSEFMESHLKTERILLINSGLDLLYIGSGLILNQLSQKSLNRADLLKGYGNSLYLQGGFLLAFDLIMYGLMRSERIKLNNDLALNVNVDLSAIKLTLLF